MRNKTDKRRSIARSIEYWRDMRIRFANLPIIGGYDLHSEITTLIGAKIADLKTEYYQLTGQFYDMLSQEESNVQEDS